MLSLQDSQILEGSDGERQYVFKLIQKDGVIYLYSGNRDKLLELATELGLDISLIREDSDTEKDEKAFLLPTKYGSLIGCKNLLEDLSKVKSMIFYLVNLDQ